MQTQDARIGLNTYEQMQLFRNTPEHQREIKICAMRFELAQIQKENPSAIMPPTHIDTSQMPHWIKWFVISTQQAIFLVDLEAMHPELTWNFETGEIEAHSVNGYPIIVYKSETMDNGYTKFYPTFKETGERCPF